MKPPTFDYFRASSLDEALDALGSSEEARLLAGGQSLVPMMNLRLARPELLIDVNGLVELDSVARRNGDVILGSLCRHRRLELDPEVAAHAPMLASAAALIGHPPIRNRGTLGGSLAHADPGSELGAALVALDGNVIAAGTGGHRRVIPASALFEGYFSTTLEPGEMIVEVVVPTRAVGEGAAIKEFAPRHGDFAVAGVAAVLCRNADGSLARVRASAFGVGSRVIDLAHAVEGLAGRNNLSDDVLREVAVGAAAACDPVDDVHATAQDRRELVSLLVVDVLRSAWEQAEDSDR